MFADGMRILIIEDNPGDAEITSEGLLSGVPASSTVLCVQTMCEALEELGRNTFDLVVTDLNLPDSKGEETLRALSKVCQPESVIVITGMDDDEAALQSVFSGATEFLLKSELSARTLHRSIRFATERLCRRRAEESLRNAEKLDAISRLAFGIAHHFNNLLTVIIGNASLLESSPLPDRESERQVRDILEASDRAAVLTRHLLQFCGAHTGNAGRLDVNAMLTSIAPMLREVLGERVQLVLGLSDHLASVSADRICLEQLVLILALNGRDAMHHGGRLTVTTQLTSRAAPHVAAPAEDPARFVKLTVTDEGTGVRPELSSHLFEPFFTTKEVGQGCGLGLAAVHGVVTQAGGFVDLVTKPGLGTSLSICLPALPDQA